MLSCGALTSELQRLRQAGEPGHYSHPAQPIHASACAPREAVGQAPAGVTPQEPARGMASAVKIARREGPERGGKK